MYTIINICVFTLVVNGGMYPCTNVCLLLYV